MAVTGTHHTLGALCTETLPHPLCSGCQYEGSSEIGVFAKLTNGYCLVCDGGSQSFYSVFEAELGGVIPIVRTTIADCKFVGRATAGEELRNMETPSTTPPALAPNAL